MIPLAGAPALLANDVTVSYADADATALKGVSLCVPVGSRVALVGPNGAGKSTLLKAAVGLLAVTQGTLQLYGHPIGTHTGRIAYLPQRGELDWHFPLSVRKLVLTGRYVHLGWLRRPSARDWAIADVALAQMQLSDLAERQISQLSGGQQQRALLARALAQEADLLLLDEPLNAVDAATRHVVADVLHELHVQGKTIIAATHELENLETEFDAALYLVDGRETHRSEHGDHGSQVRDEAHEA